MCRGDFCKKSFGFVYRFLFTALPLNRISTANMPARKENSVKEKIVPIRTIESQNKKTQFRVFRSYEGTRPMKEAIEEAIEKQVTERFQNKLKKAG